MAAPAPHDLGLSLEICVIRLRVLSKFFTFVVASIIGFVDLSSWACAVYAKTLPVSLSVQSSEADISEGFETPEIELNKSGGSIWLQSPFAAIPIIGDTHGDLEALYEAVRRLQIRHQRFFPLVIQLGDMEYLTNNIPTSSRRPGHGPRNDLVSNHVAGDDKLYQLYYQEAKGFERLSTRVLWIRGNHDNGTELERLVRQNSNGLIAVDRQETLLYLPDGRPLLLKVGENQEKEIEFIGVGGVDPNTRRQSTQRYPGIEIKEEFLAPDFLGAFEPRPRVLLTHQGPPSALQGSPCIDLLRSTIRPEAHLFGHSHTPSQDSISEGLGILTWNAVKKGDFKSFSRMLIVR
ncbi:MAG: metallophosphatase family protein [Bradymonadales bacterium]|nr:MAG: metallophosphatase family protein [Bradymonadales bacterium]